VADYTIKRGDTLSAIAKANNTTVDALMKANPSIKKADLIYAGNTLSIPGINAPTSTPVTAPAPAPTPVAPTAVDPAKVNQASALNTPGMNVLESTPGTTTPTLSPDISAILDQMPSYDPGYYGIDPNPEPFSYDPSTDASLQQFLDQGNASIMQEMANRGVTNSTTTATQIANLLKGATPEYEQAAYNRWSADQARELERANFFAGQQEAAYNRAQDLQNSLISQLSALDDEGYASYKEQLVTVQAQRSANIQSAQTYYEQKKAALENAIAKVNSTGFVDNDTALVLGIEAGTPASGIAAAVSAKQQELQQLQYKIANLVSENQQRLQAENIATAFRDNYYNPRVIAEMKSPVSSGSQPKTNTATVSDAVINTWNDIKNGYYGNLTSAQLAQIDQWIQQHPNDASLVQTIIKMAEMWSKPVPETSQKTGKIGSSTGTETTTKNNGSSRIIGGSHGKTSTNQGSQNSWYMIDR